MECTNVLHKKLVVMFWARDWENYDLVFFTKYWIIFMEHSLLAKYSTHFPRIIYHAMVTGFAFKNWNHVHQFVLTKTETKYFNQQIVALCFPVMSSTTFYHISIQLAFPIPFLSFHMSVSQHNFFYHCAKTSYSYLFRGFIQFLELFQIKEFVKAIRSFKQPLIFSMFASAWVSMALCCDCMHWYPWKKWNVEPLAMRLP